MHGQFWQKTWQKTMKILAKNAPESGKNLRVGARCPACLPPCAMSRPLMRAIVKIPHRRQDHPRHRGIGIDLGDHFLKVRR
jgi:hypothetical protein